MSPRLAGRVSEEAGGDATVVAIGIAVVVGPVVGFVATRFVALDRDLAAEHTPSVVEVEFGAGQMVAFVQLAAC